MNGFKARLLLVAATAMLAPVAASAQNTDHQLTTTAKITLTILPSAVVGPRSERGLTSFTAAGNSGTSLDGSGVMFSVRDSRGERAFSTLQRLQAAIADATRRGERELDVTLVF